MLLLVVIVIILLVFGGRLGDTGKGLGASQPGGRASSPCSRRGLCPHTLSERRRVTHAFSSCQIRPVAISRSSSGRTPPSSWDA